MYISFKLWFYNDINVFIVFKIFWGIVKIVLLIDLKIKLMIIVNVFFYIVV